MRLGSASSGLDSCSTERDRDELSIDLEKAFRGERLGLQSFGVVAIITRIKTLAEPAEKLVDLILDRLCFVVVIVFS